MLTGEGEISPLLVVTAVRIWSGVSIELTVSLEEGGDRPEEGG